MKRHETTSDRSNWSRPCRAVLSALTVPARRQLVSGRRSGRGAALRSLLGAIALAAVLPTPLSGAAPSPREEDPLRIVISVAERRLWVIAGWDTLLSAPVAVGSGRTLRGKDKSWTFTTPRGEAIVVRKERDPVWIPPDWHYEEIAAKNRLRLERLDARKPVTLRDGSVLVVRGEVIGIVWPDSSFHELPADEEIILDDALYIPPFGTRNRRVEGALGPYRLILSNGVGIHGTPYKESIGEAETHGCIRMYDDDISFLFENVPVGARVTII